MAEIAGMRPAKRAAGGGRSASAARLFYGMVSIASAAGFILLWEGLAASGVIDAEFFPPPTLVSGELGKLLGDGTLIDDVLVSSRRVLVGFGLSALLGTALGILLGSMRPLRWMVQPVISIIRPLPSL